MTLTQSIIDSDRMETAMLLADKLHWLRNSEAVIIGASRGGAVIGYHLAGELQLPFEVFPCRKLMYPGNKNKSMGSISADEVIIHDDKHDIPRDYIYHQIVLNQNAIKAQRIQYNSGLKPVNINGRRVVIVVNKLVSSDSVMAAIKSLRKHSPKQIIVAASLATLDAINTVSLKADDIVTLTVEDDIRSERIYREPPPISDDDLKRLIAMPVKGN